MSILSSLGPLFAFCSSQPAPAYDLLVRFLTKKTMIDEELPQIRASSPVTPEPLSWVHLYPTGKKAYDNSFTEKTAFSLNDVDIASSTQAAFGDADNWSSPLTTNRTPEAASSSTTALLSAFVAGLVVALVLVQFVVNRRPRRQNGYTDVPDNIEEVVM